MDISTFKKHAHEMVDWIADYLENLERYPVQAQVQPGDVAKMLPTRPPETSESMDAILDDFNKIVMPGMTHWQHPSWFAYFPANSSPPSVLAEFLTAALGAQCMGWQTCPAATELESVVIEWLRQMLDLPKGMTGVIQDTASTATLCALLASREKVSGNQINNEGFRSSLVVYTSIEAHSSVLKGAKIAGFGADNVRFVPTDQDLAMDPTELLKLIEEDLSKDLIPACVVATVGTTSSTAMDPLRPIGEICRKKNIWMHVDAAFAGTAAILPEKRWILDGVELANSFVFNPHKWMFTNFDCSAFFVKDEEDLLQTFEINPEYLKTDVTTPVKNYRDWGIQLGRRFRALKLWFVIRSYGVSGLQEMVRDHLHLAEHFKRFVENSDFLELMAPVPVSTVCFRLNDGRPKEDLEELNKKLQQKLNNSGKLFLTHTRLRGKYVLRMAIGSRTTKKEHILKAMKLIQDFGDELCTLS